MLHDKTDNVWGRFDRITDTSDDLFGPLRPTASWKDFDTSHVQPATQATHAGSQHPENEKHVNTGWMNLLSVKSEMGGEGGGGSK